MALTDHKITSYQDNVKALSDYPSDDGVTAEQLKAIFDGRTDKEVKNAINGIIDTLTAPGGAAEIGTDGGKDIQAALNGKADTNDPLFTPSIRIKGSDGQHRIGEGGNSSGRTEIQNTRFGTKRCLIIGEDELRYRIGNDLTEHKIYAENNKPTKADVGLSNVDNTSDMDKPISTAVQAALDTKMEKAALELETPVLITGEDPTGIYEPVGKISVDEHEVVIAHETATLPLAPALLIGDYGLRYQEDGVTYGVYTENNKPTKADVGLSNVDNTSDADKPVSTATQAVLDKKADQSNPDLSGTITVKNQDTSKMRVEDAKAQYIEFSVTPGGEADTPTLSIRRGNTAEYFDTGKIYTSYDKPPVDSELSATSENPLQNKAVKAELDGKAPISSPVFSGKISVNSVSSGAEIESSAGKLTITQSGLACPETKVEIHTNTIQHVINGESYPVYTAFNPQTTMCGFSFASMTQEEYEALAEKDENTIYLVV